MNRGWAADLVAAGGPGNDSAQIHGLTMARRNLTAMDTQRGSLLRTGVAPVSIQRRVARWRGTIGTEPACHLIVIDSSWADADPIPGFLRIVTFLSGVAHIQVGRNRSMARGCLTFMTRVVDRAMLANCEIYLSFAGGKAAVQR